MVLRKYLLLQVCLLLATLVGSGIATDKQPSKAQEKVIQETPTTQEEVSPEKNKDSLKNENYNKESEFQPALGDVEVLADNLEQSTQEQANKIQPDIVEENIVSPVPNDNTNTNDAKDYVASKEDPKKVETSKLPTEVQADSATVTEPGKTATDGKDSKLHVEGSNVESRKTSQTTEQVNNIKAPTDPPPPELTEEQKKEVEMLKRRESLYHDGMKMINSSNVRSSIMKGYQLLHDAAELGHADAEVEIGFGHLAGGYLKMQIKTAFDIFNKHAARGNPRAQAGLGFMYATGIGTNSSQAKALVYLTFAALGDDTMGRMMLGYRYWAGIGVTSNCESSLNYYRKVAEEVAANAKLGGGSLVSRIRLIDDADRPGSSYGLIDDDLIQYYQFLADKGDAPAQVTLGQLNYQGTQGFEQNLEKAFDYFSKAAETGNANAQGYLGKMYAEGSAKLKQNNETALKYFKLASNQGNPIGQAGLGLMYLYGKGVKLDYDKAFRHFQSSSDQGWPEGQLQLGNMYFNGQGVKRDYKQAVRFFNLAAQNGHLLALYYLAKMHATGTGVVRSCQTAVELYKNVCERGRWSSLFELAYSQYKIGRVDSSLSTYLLLAELGYEVAQSNAAYILDKEQSSLLRDQIFARALVHWDRAAEQGYSVARIKLGDYHYYGKGTEIDYEIAASHYKVATEQNSNAQAMFNLGYMHEQGLGMKKDIHLAKRHYDMAAEASPDAFAPVSLALLKIWFLFFADFLQNQRWFHSSTSRLSTYFSDDWDLYLMTLLALMLGFVIAYRRQVR